VLGTCDNWNFNASNQYVCVGGKRKEKRIMEGATSSLISHLGQLKHCNNHNIYRILFDGERLMRSIKKIIRQK
jgi:hypothetical protein